MKVKKNLHSLIVESEDTDMIVIAGREVTIAQKPYVEANISAARTVLDRLLTKTTRSTSNISNAISSTRVVAKIVES